MRAITAGVIAVGVKYNMASQFRFGCILVTIIKIAICSAQTILPHPVSPGQFTQSLPEMSR